jgi:hypothetical protein
MKDGFVAKDSRFQTEYRESASKLHIKVGEALRSSPLFGSYRIYQEYPVSKVLSSYKGSHFFDWVVLDLKVVFECHGRQHYQVSTFGGISKEEAHTNLLDQRHRDNEKMDAAIKAGWTYVDIPYYDIDDITDTYLWSLYKRYLNPLPPLQEEEVPENPYHQAQLEKARTWRSEQYQRTKAKLKAIKDNED